MGPLESVSGYEHRGTFKPEQVTPELQPPPQAQSPRVSHRSIQFLRFVVSGGVSAAADVLLLAALVALGTPRLAATPMAFLSGAFLNYTLHRRFTFQTTRPASGGEFFRYGCVVAFNMLLTSALVEGLTGGLGLALVVGKLATLPVIAVSGFVLSRTFVFNQRRSNDRAPR